MGKHEMRVRDLEAWITERREYSQQKLVARLFAIFSVLTLLLAAAGSISWWSDDVTILKSRLVFVHGGQKRRVPILRVEVPISAGLCTPYVRALLSER
jgi:hypothetical protein